MISNYVSDAKGLSCPMPIVRTKKTIDTLRSGEVLEVHVTDKGAHLWIFLHGQKRVVTLF